MRICKTHFSVLCKLVSIPILSGVAGILLLAIVFALPTGRMWKNVKRSLPVLSQEHDYFSVTPSFPGTTLDNFSDAMYLNQALVGMKDAGFWKSVLGGCQYDVDTRLQQTENLAAACAAPRRESLKQRSLRFFNGYQAVLKPLLLLGDLSSIRQLNLLFQFVLLVWLCLLMHKRHLDDYIPPFVLSILFINPASVALCMAFSGFYYCMIIPCIVMLIANDRLKSGIAYWLFFDFVGACTFYFNMNYFQLVTFGVPLIFYFMLNGVPDSARGLLWTSVSLFASWFIGYAGMMIFKWLVYAVTIDSCVFAEMISNALFRASVAKNPDGTGSIPRIMGIVSNLIVALQNYWWCFGELIFVLYWMVKCFRKQTRLKISRTDLYLFLFMSLIVAGRLLIFANHVYIHCYYMYRILLIPILTFNILLVKACRKSD